MCLLIYVFGSRQYYSSLLMRYHAWQNVPFSVMPEQFYLFKYNSFLLDHIYNTNRKINPTLLSPKGEGGFEAPWLLCSLRNEVEEQCSDFHLKPAQSRNRIVQISLALAQNFSEHASDMVEFLLPPRKHHMHKEIVILYTN